MSKIYAKYLELKSENKDKLYLFKSGKFYIFIGDDADKINNYVVLKKTKFSNETMKCGFPENVLEEYLRVFENHKLNIQIVEDIKLKSQNIKDIILELDINHMTPIDALCKLKELKEIVLSEKDG